VAAPSRGPTRRASPTEPPTPAVTPAEAAETAETTQAEAPARETAPDTPPSLGDRVLAIIARRPLLRVTEREVRIGARAFKTVLLTGVATPLLFLGAMGLGLGGLIDANSGDVEGLTYLAFVTPGILCAASLQTAASDCMWPIMGGLKWMKSYHAAAATPLTPADVYGGYVVWVGCRLAVNATFFVIVAALLGGISSPWGVLAIPAAVAGALAVGAPLAAYSGGRENDVTFPIIFRVLIMPLFLFSGTFFAVDQLPAAIRPLAWASPLWHAVELARGATTGDIDALAAAGHIAFLVACITAGWLWGTRVFTRQLAS
jgi:lipooligosaccharide transport system permease protein